MLIGVMTKIKNLFSCITFGRDNLVHCYLYKFPGTEATDICKWSCAFREQEKVKKEAKPWTFFSMKIYLPDFHNFEKIK